MTTGSPRDGLPLLYQRLLELDALTLEDANTLIRESIATLPDLELSLDDGRAARVLPPSSLDRVAGAVAALVSDSRPLTLGRAVETLEKVQSHLQKCYPGLEDLVPAGDVRRFEPLIGSLVLVGRTADPPSAIEAICSAAGAERIPFRSGRRALLGLQGTEIDVRVAAPDEYGTTLFLATGSHTHVRAVIGRRGLRGFVAREQDLYAQAGLAWIPPELRHNTGEVEAARTGALPALVDGRDIRGDLHMHTTYSDGQDTLETVVATSVSLGYQYIAITDHSENASASRTVSRELLLRQRDEIARMRERYPQIAVLHGVEVDILPNGHLDFPDEVLEGLDIVLASLHDAARHDPATLTRRCLAAIQHPLVNVVTHPSNQLVGRRNGYELDYPSIYAAAAETGTALEVDGAPSHLDLDGEHARAAVQAGVTLTIDSDGHRARALARQMVFGVGTARRGWVETRHVLNARPLDDVQRFVRAKRSR